MHFTKIATVFLLFIGSLSFGNSRQLRPVNDSSSVLFGGPDCGVCGTSYQACCLGFGAKGYPCDCHLTEGGSGESGSNCGDCGTAYSACCIGYAADGYPCQCDVL